MTVTSLFIHEVVIWFASKLGNMCYVALYEGCDGDMTQALLESMKGLEERNAALPDTDLCSLTVS